MLNLRAHILVQGLSLSSLVSSAVQVSIGIAPHDPLVRQHARNAIRPGRHNAAPPRRGRNPGRTHASHRRRIRATRWPAGRRTGSRRERKAGTRLRGPNGNAPVSEAAA